MAKSLAARGLVNGVDSLRWDGGFWAGVPILVSDAQTANRITAVDATGLVVLLGPLELRSSEQGLGRNVRHADANDAHRSAPFRMFDVANECQCLRAERTIAVKGIRPTAWAHTTNVQLGQGADVLWQAKGRHHVGRKTRFASRVAR